ncbi:unnamed protein product, partial [Cuscuta epithymum]
MLQLISFLWVSRKVLLHGTLGEDGHYKFQISPAIGSSKSVPVPYSSQSANMSSCLSTCNQSLSCNKSQSYSQTSDCNVWHLRLGHPHLEALKSVLKYCNIPTINKNHVE